MSDTPKTDDLEARLLKDFSGTNDPINYYKTKCRELANHARQLERSNAELLEALEIAKATILDANRNGWTRGHPVLAIINAAIAKAKGE